MDPPWLTQAPLEKLSCVRNLGVVGIAALRVALAEAAPSDRPRLVDPYRMQLVIQDVTTDASGRRFLGLLFAGTGDNHELTVRFAVDGDTGSPALRELAARVRGGDKVSVVFHPNRDRPGSSVSGIDRRLPSASERS